MNKPGLILAVLLVSCIFISFEKSFARPKPMGQGQSIYASNCQSCHRQGTNPLSPEKQLGESSKLATQSIFREFLSAKHGRMPKFQEIAAKDIELKELYSYAKSLKNQSWEYPQVEAQPQDLPMKDAAPSDKAE